MTNHTNALGQPIGAPLPGWTPASPPPRQPMDGHWCRLEPLNTERHARDLFDAFAADELGRSWTYSPSEPITDFAAFQGWCTQKEAMEGWVHHAILNRETGKALGVASYLRIDPAVGSIEVGAIHYSPALQRTPIATEAMYLLMRRVFDELGYRRYEWKCDSLNEPSRQAAKRLGFTYEGRFRQATTYKNRNRDTDWFSILDHEWPALKDAFEAWLNPANFDDDGQQQRSLRS
ncbi:MAG: GNAT family N-acetyltransferase [Rhodospirillaceae bacterium]|jgi:RimJ/RimL family protein N-acetyltransferase|nr:GNAT family N-acetyltransferase [Rhodospirillaceae bacterium]MBT5664667.1 GNAT family N-acetyltransferase [Rhodospirillaceae bacterium]MBT5810362.1 GNAT family N-acetyltransferase [Rhodospirillaceae bacterium]